MRRIARIRNPGRLGLMAGLCLCLAVGTLSAEGIAVIANSGSPISTIDRQQLSDLYLGRKKALSGRIKLNLYSLTRDSALRRQFFASMNGMSLAQVDAYWARLQFTGRVYPPPKLPAETDVIRAVSKDVSALGYVSEAALTDEVKVLLWLK